MLSLSKILCRRLMWGLLLALLVVPVMQSAVAAPPAQPAEPQIVTLRTVESGPGVGGFSLHFSGLPGVPEGGGAGGSDPSPEEGDPDDFGCRVDTRVVEFLLTEVYIMMMRL